MTHTEKSCSGARIVQASTVVWFLACCKLHHTATASRHHEPGIVTRTQQVCRSYYHLLSTSSTAAAIAVQPFFTMLKGMPEDDLLAFPAGMRVKGTKFCRSSLAGAAAAHSGGDVGIACGIRVVAPTPRSLQQPWSADIWLAPP